jgi:hypothetical protein
MEETNYHILLLRLSCVEVLGHGWSDPPEVCGRRCVAALLVGSMSFQGGNDTKGRAVHRPSHDGWNDFFFS